jgi:hypothetical protein
MTNNWTDAERLAAEVLSSGSDETLRKLLAEFDKGLPGRTGSRSPYPSSASRRSGGGTSRARGSRGRRVLARAGSLWRASGLLDTAVDGVVVVIALACIAIGARPVAILADARPMISEALQGVSIPSAVGELSIGDPSLGTAASTGVARPVAASEPISLMARSLEATISRYRAVAAMYAQNRLPCSQLRRSYGEVDDGWTRYSIARSRTYSGEVPDHLIPWDAALYEAVRDVDRDFTASGCNRP